MGRLCSDACKKATRILDKSLFKVFFSYFEGKTRPFQIYIETFYHTEMLSEELLKDKLQKEENRTHKHVLKLTWKSWGHGQPEPHFISQEGQRVSEMNTLGAMLGLQKEQEPLPQLPAAQHRGLCEADPGGAGMETPLTGPLGPEHPWGHYRLCVQ